LREGGTREVVREIAFGVTEDRSERKDQRSLSLAFSLRPSSSSSSERTGSLTWTQTKARKDDDPLPGSNVLDLP
jgi:hypothetical protein